MLYQEYEGNVVPESQDKFDDIIIPRSQWDSVLGMKLVPIEYDVVVVELKWHE